jgi:hypothetical protein
MNSSRTKNKYCGKTTFNIAAIVMIAIALLIITGCANDSEKSPADESAPVQAENGDSAVFSAAEIASAEDVIKGYFQALSDCATKAALALQTPIHSEGESVFPVDTQFIVKNIVYDKDSKQLDHYMNGGRGAEYGLSPENVIVLVCDFEVIKGPGADPDGFEDGVYEDWSMILIRESRNAGWLIDDQGY